MARIDQLAEYLRDTHRAVKSRLGTKIVLVTVSAFPICVGVITLALHDPPTGDAQQLTNQTTQTAVSPNNAVQLAHDGAIAGAILSSFDNIASKRRRAYVMTYGNLNAIRMSSEKAVAQQSIRAAQTMVSLSFAGNLLWGSGGDLFDDHNRHWTLFDHALAETSATLNKAEDEFARQQLEYERKLQQDQRLYCRTMSSRHNHVSATVAPPRGRPIILKTDIEPRIMKQVNNRLKKIYPKEIRKAAVKLGQKQILKAPSAAFDGPLPVMEAALLILALYDVGAETADLKRTAKVEIAKTIATESNTMVQAVHNHTMEQVLKMEKLAKHQRCYDLGKAINKLFFPAKETELAKRCK